MIYYEGQSMDFSVSDIYVIEKTSYVSIDLGMPKGIAAVIGTSNFGPSTSIAKIYSKSGLTKLFGTRSGGTLVPFVETLLDCGTKEVHLLSVFGSGAAKATKSIAAGESTNWVFTAKYNGTVGNSIKVRIIEGSLANTVSVEVLYADAVELTPNVTNNPTDENYIGKKFASMWVDFSKTGTATTLPEDADWTNLAGGSNGSAPADGDYITALDSFETDLDADLIAIAKDTTSALRAGLINHCAVMKNRIAFTTPLDMTSIPTIVADMQTRNDKRVAVVYPAFNYYNRETNAYTAQHMAWFMGVTGAISPFEDPLGKNITFGALSTQLSRDEAGELSRANVCYGWNGRQGVEIKNSKLEYKHSYFGNIMIRRTFDRVEKAIDDSLQSVLGYTGNEKEVQGLLFSMINGALSRFVDEGWINGVEKIDVSGNTPSLRMQGKATASVIITKYPAIQGVIIYVYADTAGYTYNEVIL